MTHVTNVAEWNWIGCATKIDEKSAICFSLYQTRAVLDPRELRRSRSKKIVLDSLFNNSESWWRVSQTSQYKIRISFVTDIVEKSTILFSLYQTRAGLGLWEPRRSGSKKIITFTTLHFLLLPIVINFYWCLCLIGVHIYIKKKYNNNEK